MSIIKVNNSKESTKQLSSNKYVAYIRVSTKEQEKGASLDEQKNQIYSYAEKNNIQIVKEYREVQTAKKVGRNIFTQMIKELKKNKVQGIIFHKVDRSSRNPSDTVKLWELTEKGYELHFVSEGLKTSDAMGKMMLHMLWGWASAYVENLRAEVKKGILGRLKEGKSPITCPVGYTDEGQSIKKVHPHLGPLVTKAFKLYATNEYSIEELTTKMTNLGLTRKRGSELNKKAMNYVLRNPFYYGVIYYDGQLWEGIHEPLVTKKLFDKVQKILDDKGPKKKRKFEYYFRSMIVCKACGKPMRSMVAKGHYKYYYCRKQDCYYKKSVPEKKVEELFLAELKRIAFTKEEGEMFVKAARKIRGDIFKTQSEQVEAIELEINNVKARQNGLLDMKLDSKIDPDVFDNKQRELVNKIAELKEQRSALDTADDKNYQEVRELGKLIRNPIKAYQKAKSGALKHQLVRSMVANFTWDGKTLMFIWKKPFSLIAERPIPNKCGPDRI